MPAEIVHLCKRLGYLLGPDRFIPDDPAEFYSGRERIIIGCTRLRCSECGQMVRVERNPLPEGQKFRTYQCACITHHETGPSRTVDYEDKDTNESALPWACAGHPVATLPLDLDGVRIADDTDFQALVRLTLFGWSPEAARPGERASPVGWVVKLYGRLLDTRIENMVSTVVAQCITDTDPRVRSAALEFSAIWGSALEGERIEDLVTGDRALFAGVPDPNGRASDTLEDRLLLALGARMLGPGAMGSTSIAMVEVPRSPRPVASNKGTLQRRRMKADGTPECVPLYPHELIARQADLGLADYSALPFPAASLTDLDPLERQRLRQAIERYAGDKSLLSLDDVELDGALGLTERQGDTRIPTVAGLLVLGTEAALRQHLPTHEVAFQVLDGTDVRVNDFYRGPLLRTFERIEEQFAARLREREVQVGLFRVAIPDIDRRAFREAVVNAFTHRDWTRLGAVHVRWEGDALFVSNPGGFVEGVTLDNLLVTEPRPRNPRLADVFKRVGLAERTGRGVDVIYKGLLRYGRPAPSYRRSTGTTVVVELSSVDADLPFLGMILTEEDRRGSPLPLDALLVLSRLRTERRLDLASLAPTLQKDATHARAAVERLVEAGLLQADGKTRGRTYTLSPQVQRQTGEAAEAVRQAGFDAIQQVEMVRRYGPPPDVRGVPRERSGTAAS